MAYWTYTLVVIQRRRRTKVFIKSLIGVIAISISQSLCYGFDLEGLEPFLPINAPLYSDFYNANPHLVPASEKTPLGSPSLLDDLFLKASIGILDTGLE